MIRTRAIALVIFCGAVAAGTLVDVPRRGRPASPRVIAGDFHVHAAPGDGMLPVWEVQREADRRGLDAIAITNHNHNVASRFGRWLRRQRSHPIVIDSQELTTPDFHMAAIGVTTMIDWRLAVPDAVADIHRQGGVAVASHPLVDSWKPRDADALRVLDGAEVAHPVVLARPEWERELRDFYDRVRQVNPDVSPIGSSDFHGGPMGIWRTYLIVDEVSREGVLDAIRRGRTVAAGPGGRLIGTDEHVAVVRPHAIASRSPGFGYGPETWIAFAALLALAVVVNVRSSPKPSDRL